MTAATVEPMDGGLRIDPKVAKVLLRHREEVAEATFRACRELRRVGVADPGALLLGRLDR